MGNSVSPYFSDEELEANLRSHFDDSNMWGINFKAHFKRIEDYNDMYYALRIQGKVFLIEKFTGEVMEKD